MTNGQKTITDLRIYFFILFNSNLINDFYLTTFYPFSKTGNLEWSKNNDEIIENVQSSIRIQIKKFFKKDIKISVNFEKITFK